MHTEEQKRKQLADELRAKSEALHSLRKKEATRPAAAAAVFDSKHEQQHLRSPRPSAQSQRPTQMLEHSRQHHARSRNAQTNPNPSSNYYQLQYKQDFKNTANFWKQQDAKHYPQAHQDDQQDIANLAKNFKANQQRRRYIEELSAHRAAQKKISEAQHLAVLRQTQAKLDDARKNRAQLLEALRTRPTDRDKETLDKVHTEIEHLQKMQQQQFNTFYPGHWKL